MTSRSLPVLTPALERAWNQVRAYCRATAAENARRIADIAAGLAAQTDARLLPTTPEAVEFEAGDVLLRPQELGELVRRLYLVVAFESNAHKFYRQAETPGAPPAWMREAEQETLAALRERAEDADAAAAEDALPPAVPDSLFRGIVGYGPVKELMLRTIQERQRVHFMLIGPPAGGKSLFLDAVHELPGALWLQGGMTTRAGFARLIVDEDPRWICFDEADEATQEDWAPFTEMLESGTVTVTNGNMRVRVERRAVVFCALNDYTKVPPKIRSRFQKVELPAYTQVQFEDVGEHVLWEREEVDRALAREFAVWAWHYGVRDIRELRNDARAHHTLEDFRAWMESPYRFVDDGKTRVRRR